MSQSLRVSVCSNCGHLLVRAASCSGNATRNRTIPYSSRRGVSWGSLLGHLRGKAVSKEPSVPSKPPDDEVRKRTEAAVRRLRETKDRAGRPPPPPPPAAVPPSHKRSASPPAQASPPPSTPAPSQRLPEELFTRDSSLGKQNEALPPYYNLKPLPAASANPNLRKVSQLADQIGDNDVLFPKSRSYNPFLSPLHAERMAVMRKYLQKARTQMNAKKEPTERGPYPWEEATPVPWDTEADKLQGLRRLLEMRAPELSRKRAEKGFSGGYLRKALELQKRKESPPTPNLDLAEEAPGLETSKLYAHLRDHHIRSMTPYSGPGSEEVEAADRELFHRIGLATQALIKQYPGKQWAANFQDWFRDTTTVADVPITPFIKYLLAKEGFKPTSYYISKRPMRNFYDDLGFINQNVLVEMIDEAYRKTVAPMHFGLVKHVIKRIQNFPNTAPARDVASSSKSAVFVTHGLCTPVSANAFQWHGIVIAVQSGEILYQSKEWVRLWFEDRTGLVQPKVPEDFLHILNEMKLSSWRRTEGIKSITRHYDF